MVDAQTFPPAIPNMPVSRFDSTIVHYMSVLNVTSINKVSKIVHKYGIFLEPIELKVMRMRLKSNSLRDIGSELNRSHESVRVIEYSALDKLRFYSALHSKNYSIKDLLMMRMKDFVEFIPPYRNNKNHRLKKSLAGSLSNMTLVEILEKPCELAKCPAMTVRGYEVLRQVLKGYKISLPDVDYYKFINRYRKNV